MKICMIASSGGHLEELAQLADVVKSKKSFLVTEKPNFYKTDMCPKTYYFNQINRKEHLFLFHFIRLCIDSIRIYRKEKPDALISTGALIAVPMAFLCRIAGKKVVYIETFARMDSPSLTGKLMYRIAGLFLVQSESLLRFYPKAKYIGCIFK